MPNSPSDVYIQALRQGDYLRFLQWAPVLIENYDATSIAAEHLISIATYKWLQAGFTEEDIEHMAIVQAIMNDEHCPVAGYLAYTATFLIAASLQNMVYQANDISDFYLSDSVLGRDEIIRFMERDNGILTAQENSEQLSQQAKVLSCKADAYQKEIKTALYHLECLQKPKHVINAYIEALDVRLKKAPDKMMSMRAGVAKALQKQIAEAQDSETINALIPAYLEKLKALGMPLDEMESFNQIVPVPLSERFLLWSRDAADTFFKKVILSRHLIEDSVIENRNGPGV